LYGKWERDFVGYKLTDFSSREELEKLVVDFNFSRNLRTNLEKTGILPKVPPKS
jgi:hypothetical protein